jgi:hypothetical protein
MEIIVGSGGGIGEERSVTRENMLLLLQLLLLLLLLLPLPLPLPPPPPPPPPPWWWPLWAETCSLLLT